MLKNILENCGLSVNEQEILLYLIRRRGSLAGAIAKNLNIKRPTVYLTLESLGKKGLVSRSQKEKVTYFLPAATHLIPQIIEERAKIQFAGIKQSASLLKPYLAEIKGENAEVGFQNLLIESADGVFPELRNALLAGDFDAIFNPQSVMIERSIKIVDEFLKETARTKPKIRELAVDSAVTRAYAKKIKNPNHQIKFMPADTLLFNDMIFGSGAVTFFDYTPKKEVAMKINHPIHYQAMVNLFDILWNIA